MVTSRRVVIALGAGAVAAPFSVFSEQQPAAIPTIGFLGMVSPGGLAQVIVAIRQGLNEGGYVEGQNVAIEYRWAQGEYGRLPALAAELAGRRRYP